MKYEIFIVEKYIFLSFEYEAIWNTLLGTLNLCKVNCGLVCHTRRGLSRPNFSYICLPPASYAGNMKFHFQKKQHIPTRHMDENALKKLFVRVDKHFSIFCLLSVMMRRGKNVSRFYFVDANKVPRLTAAELTVQTGLELTKISIGRS